MPNDRIAAHTPTTSRIESSAPTSCSSTRAGSMPWIAPSTSARAPVHRRRVAPDVGRQVSGLDHARSRRRPVDARARDRDHRGDRGRRRRRRRCWSTARSTPQRWTRSHVAAYPSIPSAAHASLTAAWSAPASISEASSMSPATPAQQLNQTARVIRAASSPPRRGAEAVVDADDGHAARARGVHRQQCRDALEAGAVTDGRRHGDDRPAGEAADHARQRALHAGDDDHRVRRCDAVEVGEHAVQTGDADVVQPVGLQCVGGERDRRLVGNRHVRRARRRDQHADVGPWRRAGATARSRRPARRHRGRRTPL